MRTCIFIFLLVWVVSCKPKKGNSSFEIVIPPGFPEVIHPDDNTYSQTRWELGKALFYDPILSVDSTLSCASCHKQELAFADNVALSNGVKGRKGKRNVPSLANVAYNDFLTREGGVNSLEKQVAIPVEEAHEMGFNMAALSVRISKNEKYKEWCERAYPKKPYHYAVSRALSVFERSLLSGNAPYDKYFYQGDKHALNSNQIKGLMLFEGKAKCSSCHSGFNFTSNGFENNGLYKVFPDSGRYKLTFKESDIGLFKVPSLRNVVYTAPYMHDGSLKTLIEVVKHYNAGGVNHKNQSELVKPLHLTTDEMNSLVEFLGSLSDYSFTSDPKFSKP